MREVIETVFKLLLIAVVVTFVTIFGLATILWAIMTVLHCVGYVLCHMPDPLHIGFDGFCR